MDRFNIRTPFLLALAFLLAVFSAQGQTVPASLPAGTDFRAAWIATVFNINFPSRGGLSAAQQQAEIISLLDTARRIGLNAVLFQVRPESDALYSSSIEPWSRYLTGVQGKDPGYDPLAFMIREGAKRGIGIHAWLNPYRAGGNASNERTSNHISRKYSSYCYRSGTMLWMDPGAPVVQEQVLSVVRDLVSRYALAGVHIDDYFYPYPKSPTDLNEFPDASTYAAYRSRGGKLGKADWRRDNVNSMIRRMREVVKGTRSSCMFGVSPFGVYRRGAPEGVVVGLDQYEHIFSDPVFWLQQGWIDYLAPQLYWKNESPQSYSKLLSFWRSPEANPRGIPIYPGMALDRMGGSHGWPMSEIALQMGLNRQGSAPGGRGEIFWNIGPLQKNTKGVADMVKNRYYR